jgi:TonB family protein
MLFLRSLVVSVVIHSLFFLSLSLFEKNEVSFQDEIFVDIVGSELINAGKADVLQPVNQPKLKPVKKQNKAEEVFSDKPIPQDAATASDTSFDNNNTDTANSSAQGTSDDEGFASGSGQLSRAPKKLYEVKPKYPQGARVKGIEGTVSLRIYISKEGKVVKADLVNGLGDEFNQAAIEAALKTIFSPALDKSGQPIGIRILYKFRFNLEE